MPKRRSIWAFTCVPRPSVKRPRDSFCSVHALIAVTVGLRGERNRDGRAELQGARRLARQRQQDERIVLGFLDNETVVADLFQQARVGGDGMEIEWRFTRTKAGINLTQWQKCLKQHVVTPRGKAAVAYEGLLLDL